MDFRALYLCGMNQARLAYHLAKTKLLSLSQKVHFRCDTTTHGRMCIWLTIFLLVKHCFDFATHCMPSRY